MQRRNVSGRRREPFMLQKATLESQANDEGPAAAAWGARETLVGAGVLGAAVTLTFLFLPGVRAPDRRLEMVPA